jgi:hypothetical protein
VPLSRRLAARVSFEGHGYAPPRNAFLELLPELIETPPALGLAGTHCGQVDYGCGDAVAPVAVAGTAAMTSAERSVPPSSSGRSS